ncbi:MAG: hypothetical protein CMH27_04215 [Micavibrio sp.]|nr:hypothetical protein [Micavibrio sp.]|tara:strand:- start:2674 stop:4257 length:1584 start_codon:yes stop_codon:yes gene_type:complete
MSDKKEKMMSFAFAKRYVRNLSGAIAIMFAFMAPAIVGSAGFALDYAMAYLVQQRLAQAIDASALAGAAESTDEAEIESRIRQFFAENYPADKVGFTFEPQVEVVGDEVRVTGNARYDTSFVRILGIDEIEMQVKTVVARKVQGIEVVLVLDNTGSMGWNNNITSLKRASQSFINIMFDNASRDEFVRIGLVPYSNSVRVGSYGLGKNPDGSQYRDGSSFVTLPHDVSVTNNHNASSGWYGCVIEHNGTNYNENATYVDGSYGQLWKSGVNWNGHGWDPARGDNDSYPYDVFPDLADGESEYEGPFDIYQYGDVERRCVESTYVCTRWRNGRCRSGYNRCDAYDGYEYDVSSRPNNSCPYAQIVPINSDRDFLLSQVDPDDYNVMYPHGNTLGNIGMLWGGRLLSPAPPFTEGKAWDSEYWKKAIVMMTDGDNTRNGTYSSFWDTSNNNYNVATYNQRFEETCTNLKKMGVLIYTVTFTSGINDNTKGYYKRCATSEDQYYDAPGQEDLEEAFRKIARELSTLHIKE